MWITIALASSLEVPTMMIRHLAKIAPSLLISLPLIACQSPQANSTAAPIVQAQNPITQVAQPESSQPQTLAQRNEQRTVTDYFLDAPDRYFKIASSVADRAQRQKLLEPDPRKKGNIIDIANGYLSVGSQAPDLCGYEMAIFRRSRGSHLVALNTRCTVGNTVIILDPDRNWRNITAEALPIVLPQDDPETDVKLPRQGKTITVTRYTPGTPDIKITFQNEEFVIER